MEIIKLFVNLLNDNEGALMVIITFVYVLATCAICWANIKERFLEDERFNMRGCKIISYILVNISTILG